MMYNYGLGHIELCGQFLVLWSSINIPLHFAIVFPTSKCSANLEFCAFLVICNIFPLETHILFILDINPSRRWYSSLLPPYFTFNWLCSYWNTSLKSSSSLYSFLYASWVKGFMCVRVPKTIILVVGCLDIRYFVSFSHPLYLIIIVIVVCQSHLLIMYVLL